MKSAIADFYGLTARERQEILGKVLRLWHVSITNQGRNNVQVTFECPRDLCSHEVVAYVQPTTTRRVFGVEPVPSNQRHKHGARIQRSVDGLDEILTGADRVNIDEHVVTAKAVPKLVR